MLETGPRLPEEDDLERTRRQVDQLRGRGRRADRGS